MKTQAIALDETANCTVNHPASTRPGPSMPPEAPTGMLADCDACGCCDGFGVRRCRDDQVELEALNEDFVITPTLARLLVILARRRLDRETLKGECRMREMERAA
jgi:hypothetical protein